MIGESPTELTWLIAVGAVVVLGATRDAVWQERARRAR